MSSVGIAFFPICVRLYVIYVFVPLPVLLCCFPCCEPCVSLNVALQELEYPDAPSTDYNNRPAPANAQVVNDRSLPKHSRAEAEAHCAMLEVRGGCRAGHPALLLQIKTTSLLLLLVVVCDIVGTVRHNYCTAVCVVDRIMW